MRFRAGLVFVFFSLWAGVGCRKPLAPTVDSNLPPETWITAAPQDTLTAHDDTGQLIPPVTGTIPFRYHLYWSGSDQDGSVVGFYWAVVETVGSIAGLPAPALPGPKQRDYHYTTKTDSTFIFNVLEGTNDRQHAFYIYAVDNKGKADPTPARMIFNSLDVFPPVPVIEAQCGTPNPTGGSRATGFVLHPNEAWTGIGPLPVPRETTIALCDTFKRGTVTHDIVPIASVVRILWHSEMRVAGDPAVAYKYKIGEGNEVEFILVPASVTGTSYNTTDTNRLGPGLKVFTLRAIDQAGAARSSPETTRRFYMNLPPDTWFAGPDSVPASNPNFYTVERYGNPVTGQVKLRYYQVGTGNPPLSAWAKPMPGSLLSPDSVNVMPALRKANRTFFEIYTENTTPLRHRIYVHSEGDTVHFNSWVLLHGGGFDPDSPYSLRINVNNPGLPGIGNTPVLTSGPPNGSPVAYTFRIPIKLGDSSGTVTSYPESQVFPLSETATSPEPHIGGYQGLQQAGRAYAFMRSVDGNGDRDNAIDDPVALVDSVERGLLTPSSPRYALRSKIITFYVDRAPTLLLDDPAFHPKANGRDTIFTRVLHLTLSKVADDDPYQTVQVQPGGVVSGQSVPVFRFSVTVRGKRTGATEDAVYAPDNLARKIQTNFDQDIIVPDYIEGPDLYVDIEVCDCQDCETTLGQGRCRRYPPIHVYMKLGPQATPSRAGTSSTGPGSSGESSRSRMP